MKLSSEQIRRLAKARGTTLGALLERAGVSRTAYYSLARRPTVLPKSVHALAKALGVHPTEILGESAATMDALAAVRLNEARAICAEDSGASFENVWHTLCLLDSPPIERLNRSLTRGRAASLHR
jgi:lambda repressor-like predicted transcriptional regulator